MGPNSLAVDPSESWEICFFLTKLTLTSSGFSGEAKCVVRPRGSTWKKRDAKSQNAKMYYSYVLLRPSVGVTAPFCIRDVKTISSFSAGFFFVQHAGNGQAVQVAARVFVLCLL